MIQIRKIIEVIRRKGSLGFLVFMAFLMVSCGSLRKQPSSHSAKGRMTEKEKDQQLISKYEQIIGEPINMQKSLALYKAIDAWMNTPYKYGSSVCREGTDCSGFVFSIYRDVYHITLDRSSEDQLKKDVRRIGKSKLKEGDLVFFKIEDGKKVSHVGIYLGNEKFVHASTKTGVCINGLDEKYYKEHFRTGGRVKPGIEERNTSE